MDNEIIVNWSPNEMLEVTLSEPDDFLKIKETLTRIGVAAKDKTLIQSCHILHKQGRYFIVHFKELFMLDGKSSNLMKSDVQRRNSIAFLLSDWGLLDVVNYSSYQGEHLASLSQIKIISHKDKHDWKLKSKYTIGNS